MPDDQLNMTPGQQLNERAAHDVWARMVALWESRPAYEAIKEMAKLLHAEGWTDGR